MELPPSGLVAVLYNRVSDDKRKLSRSVPEQEDAGQAALTEYGWIHGGSFSDTDMSASRFAKKARPDWAKLVDDVLPSGRVQILVLWEPSRGTRMLSAWALLLEACQELGIRMHITSHEQTYDLSKPRHWKSLADDGVKAVYDSEETSLRVRRSVAGHAATGKPYGKVLYGYERIYDKKTKEFVAQVIREDQAEVVRLAAKWIAEKKSLASLVEHLHEQQIRAPHGGEWWSTVQLKKMVSNPAYIGKRVHRGKVLRDAVWPTILASKVHADCVEVLTAEGRSQERDGAVKHMLSGLCTCGRCGGVLRVQENHGRTYYTCKTRCVALREVDLDDYIRDVTLERVSRKDFATLLTDVQGEDARQAEEEAQRLRNELEGYYQQAEPSVPPGDRLSPLGLARMERKYEPLIEAAERRSVALRVPPVLRELAGRDDLAEYWPLMQMSQQREVIRVLMTITITPLGRGRRAPVQDRVVVDWIR